MKFPREFVEIDWLTPEHVDGSCIAYVPLPGGPQKSPGEPLLVKGGISYRGENWKASRLSFSLNVKKLPKAPATLKKGIVCHHCDNAWCINPKHLYLGTASQNTKDIFERNKYVRERMSKAGLGNSNSKGNKFPKELTERLAKQRIGNSHRKGKLKGQLNKRGTIIEYKRKK